MDRRTFHDLGGVVGHTSWILFFSFWGLDIVNVQILEGFGEIKGPLVGAGGLAGGNMGTEKEASRIWYDQVYNA